MANLLPTKQRRNIEREHTIRVSIVALILILTTLSIALLLLLPTLFLAHAQALTQTNRLADAQRLLALRQDTTANKDVQIIRAYLEMLEVRDRPVSAEKILYQVLERTPSTIGLDSFTYTDQGARVLVRLSGVASNRETLVAYADELETSPFFREVVIPVSNFAQRENIPFILSLEIIIEHISEDMLPDTVEDAAL